MLLEAVGAFADLPCPPYVRVFFQYRFMALYTVGGVCSSFAHLFMHRKDPHSPAMGASGAINAVCTVLFVFYVRLTHCSGVIWPYEPYCNIAALGYCADASRLGYGLVCR